MCCRVGVFVSHSALDRCSAADWQLSRWQLISSGLDACRIAQQAWSPCRVVASSPGERWVLTWNQQRVEFVHDGSGQMMMRVGQAEDWLEVQPFWTVDHSLCWGSVCATGVIPLE